MPGLSGLELIEKTKEISPQTVFIILSGYQEFEYARTAMQYGVRHYLIKPCSCEKMGRSAKRGNSGTETSEAVRSSIR